MKTTPDSISEIINDCARGSYQVSLLDGGESWSGSSIRGAARQYGFWYARSRASLLRRINVALPDGWTADDDTLSVPVIEDRRDGTTRSSHRLVRELLVFGDDGDMYLHGAYYAR